MKINWRGVGWSLATDVRSAIVGSLVGAIVALSIAAAGQKHVSIYTNENGHAQPLGLLIDLATRSQDAPMAVKLQPAELREALVCEFARVSAPSNVELLFSYLDKYSACFSVRQLAENEFEISPNQRSGEMRKQGSDWLCKCPSAPSQQL